MKDIWSKISTIIMGCMVVFIIVPLIVALVTTAHIIDVNTESQWIGFCGNYLGALIGGAISGSITMYVLFKTLEDNKKTLDITLENDRKLQKRKEIINFCNLLTERYSALTPNLSNLVNKAHDYINEENIQNLREFSVLLHTGQGIMGSISMQLQVNCQEDIYFPEDAEEIDLKVTKLKEKTEEFYSFVLQMDKINEEDDKFETQIYEEMIDIVNDIGEKIVSYQKKLVQNN